MAYETLLTQLEDGVMTVTLNRPDKLNAFNTVMSRELIDFFHGVNQQDEVRAIVVTGAGRAFCAGADLSGGGRTFDYAEQQDLADHRDTGGVVALRIFELKKPIPPSDKEIAANPRAASAKLRAAE